MNRNERELMSIKKNVVLADCPAEEVTSFLEGLNSAGDCRFECISEIACGIRTGAVSEIRRYYAYFKAAWHAFRQRESYQLVLGWQQFYALIFCFYCSMFRVRKQNTVVALNFTYKEKSGKLGKLYAGFMRKCVCGGYLDYIHVPSAEYADWFSAEFQFPRDHIIVTRFGVDDIYGQWKDSAAPDGLKANGYAMSIGRSNRDFAWLIRAWADIDFPLILISDTFDYRGTLPKNVTLIKNVAGDAQYPYIANAKVMIIPIDNGKICSGDTVLLTALSFARNVIVTTPSTLGEMYIQDKANGYLVEKDERKIKALVDGIVSGETPDIGHAARESYLKNFSRYSMGKRIAEFMGDEGYV